MTPRTEPALIEVTSRYPPAMSTITRFSPPSEYQCAAPPARLVIPDTTAASRSALARARGADPASPPPGCRGPVLAGWGGLAGAGRGRRGPPGRGCPAEAAPPVPAAAGAARRPPAGRRPGGGRGVAGVAGGGRRSTARRSR